MYKEDPLEDGGTGWAVIMLVFTYGLFILLVFTFPIILIWRYLENRSREREEKED